MAKEKRPPASNYRKPPVEHQFKEGQSGNPQGRPKKKKASPNFGALGGALTDPLGIMLMEEALRIIPVREDGTRSFVPAMQGMFRAMFRGAADGDAKAARQLLTEIARTHQERSAAMFELLKEAMGHKKEYDEIFERHERLGLEPPEIYPNPDDFIFDQATGMFVIDGPTTKDEAGARKAFREQAIKAMGRYFEVEVALQKDPKDRKLKRELKELKKYKDFLDSDAARDARHKALQIARRALQKPESPESEDDISDQ